MPLNWIADLKQKEFKKWDRQHKIELRAYNKHICNYYIDFVITHHDGTLEYIEVKGFETNTWRMKWKLTKAKLEAEEPRNKLTLVR